MTRNERKDHKADQTDGGGGRNLPAIVVGIGVGAGGAKSLANLLPTLPSRIGAAYMLIRHPEPAIKELTIDELKSLTELEVIEAADEMPVLPDRLHVVSQERFLGIEDGKLTLKTPEQCEGLWMPIDHFFCALAADRWHHACGILLSGNGSDGTLGLSAIKAADGNIIVEDPERTEHSGMSQSAISAGVAESVLQVEAMAAEIAALAKHAIEEMRKRRAASLGLDPGLRVILEILHAKVGHDFRCYKPNTLVRRVHRRMSLGGIGSFGDYARFLEDHSDEVVLLQQDLQIGVTEFFRQPKAWGILEEKVIAAIIENAQPGSEIRAWVPGCSTGQEAYSLAMLLTDRVEKSGKNLGAQIFATDSDQAALAIARLGRYSDEEIKAGMPPEYLKRFFVRKDGRHQIIKDIRERIVFAPQNITADPPFSRLDLISCRNLLMYLDQQVQQKIFAIFHFALHEGGFLFLGTAETIGDREDLFAAVSKKWRIYRRIGVGRSLGLEIPISPAGGAQSWHAKMANAPSTPRQSLTSTAQQVLLDRFAPASVMIDRKLQVLYVHGAVEEYLTFPTGELTMHVVDMARDGLRARLRGAIGKCIETNRPVSINARVRRGSKSMPVRTTVSPLRYPRSADGLLLVTFVDHPMPALKSQQNAAGENDLLQLEDELKINREELQSTIEQLENANDQFKASNEEVTASNEELQAANEELETSKEELQSLNEELNTANTNLNEKVDELATTNNDVVNLLSSTAIATLFLDRKLRVKRYTPAITRLFSLIPSDMGRSIADILRRFTDETLLDDVRRVLADLTPLAKEVQADDGKWYIRRITPYRTQDDRIEGVVVTLVDFTDRKRADEDLRESQRRLAVIVESIADGFYALDRKWRITHINEMALRHFNKTREDMLGRSLFDLYPGLRGTLFDQECRRAMESGESVHFETASIITDLIFEVHAYPGTDNMTILFRDVTERRRMVEALREAHERAIWLARFPEENPDPVVRASAEGIVLYCNPRAADDSLWACRPDQSLIEQLRPLVSEAISSQTEVRQDIGMGHRFYDISVTPFLAESYVNIYGKDITQRKQAEKKLQDANEKLEAVNKEMESFSYSVSHDLHTPLRAIEGYARMLLKKHGDQLDAEILGKLNVIQSNTRKMGQLIDDLLSFSRLSRSQLSTTVLDMDALVGEVMEELQAGNPDRQITFKIDPIPQGMGDRTLIRQVLSNLLENAIKFTKKRDDARIEVGGSLEGNEKIYFIRDNGAGFDMKYYDKLFGVFKRLHGPDDFEGTGIGLSIVQRIIHRHGGRVWAEGKVDAGATFYFTLPGSGGFGNAP